MVLLERVELAGRLTIDLTELRSLAEEREAEIASYLADNDEVREVVAGTGVAVRRVRTLPRVPAPACSQTTSRCRPATRSVCRSSSSWPGWRPRAAPTPGRRRTRDPCGRARQLDDAVRDLVALLDLEDLDVDLFRGAQPDSARPRVYGGQVAAQALVAAVRSVDPDYHVHSFHSYFLLPGDYSVPIVYEVERIRDGRSFLTRRVMARQHGRPIYYQTAQLPAARGRLRPPGRDARGRRPGGRLRPGRPDARPRQRRGRRARQGVGRDRRALPRQLPPRAAAGPTATSPRRGCGSGSRRGCPTTRSSTWPRSPTPATSACSARRCRRTTSNPSKTLMASLDHTIWFHRPFRADEWWLYDQWSPSA